MSAASLFKDFTSKTYKEQGKAFLNAYWGEHKDDAEKVWTWANKFAELDLDKGEAGSDLDEFNAHRFLEHFKETKTVKQMRAELTAADLDFNKRVALIEYCLWTNGHSIADFVKRPQGGNADEINKATKFLEEAQALCKDAIEKRDAAAKAEAELKAALAETKAQEDAYNSKTETLKAKSETGGVVSKNRAKAELAQHLAEDPMPLRRAKITQEAATKKAERARKAADDSVDAAQAKMAEAEEALQRAKLQGGDAGQGNIWWMERDLTEAKKYMPTKKGGIRH